MPNTQKYMIILMVLMFGLFWSSQSAMAQDQGATVLRIAGKAEILDKGRRTEAKEGHKLLPGQSIQLIGGGEVRLSTTDGKVKIKVLENTTVRYDGDVGSNSQPWSSTNQYQRTTTTNEPKVPQLTVPIGRLELDVDPGQELRIVCPLIMAAVRGTTFSVTVDLDGTSRVDLLDGSIATYGRNGEMRLLMSGQSAMVTARQYTDFLANRGVSSPRGDWKNVPARTQERVDNDAVGAIFVSEGGDLLVAVLANSDSSPTAGVNALAIESASGETGSLFVEDFGGSNAGSSGADLSGGTPSVLPESPFFDQGLLDIITPKLYLGQTAYFIGINAFSLPGTAADQIFNKMMFDLNLGTGQITNAGFDIEYLHTYISVPERTQVVGLGGTGQLDFSTLHFSISGFNYHNFFMEDVNSPGSTFQGNLGSGTVISGSLAGPLDFGSLGSGTLTADYTLGTGTDNGMQTTFNFGGSPMNGALDHHPFVDVYGSFNLAGVGGIAPFTGENDFEFQLNLNTRQIFDGNVDINYNISGNNIDIFLWGGTGSLTGTGSTFTVSFPYGEVDDLSLPSSPATGVLTGNFDSNNPNVGSRVVPGSGSRLAISTAHSFIPPSIDIAAGSVHPAGQ